MVELRQHRKDMDFSIYDYVFEDVDKFEKVLPYLLPKLEGSWKLLLVEPKMEHIRCYLDTSVIPSYIDLLITVDANQLEQLYLERPNLVEKERTPWDIYMDLIKQFPVPMEDKALRELYFRVGPKETDLAAALVELEQYDYISMKVINKHFAPVQRVFASQVVRAFLLGRFRLGWTLLSKLETEIGSTVSFYAIRKYLRRLLKEKEQYLQNEDVKERIVEQVDGYTLILLYWLFETATSPNQLYPILQMFERRQTPC